MTDTLKLRTEVSTSSTNTMTGIYRQNSELTVSEIDGLIERLTTSKVPSERVGQVTSQRLSCQSLMESGLTRHRPHNPLESCDVMLEESRLLSENAMTRAIREAFGDVLVLTKEQIEAIFIHLGVLDRGEDLNWRLVYRDIMDDWELDENVFDADEARKALLNAVSGQATTKFEKLAFKKMSAKYHNRKEPKLPVLPEETYQGLHVLSISTFDRITAAKEEPPAAKQFVPVKVEVSVRSKRICRTSEHGAKDVVQRSEDLERRRRERKEKMKQMEAPTIVKHANIAVEVDKERVLERKAMRRKRLVNEMTPSFRPAVTDYAEYKKRMNRMKDWKPPPGYQDDVSRRRAAVRLSEERRKPPELMLPCRNKVEADDTRKEKHLQ